MKFAKIHLFFYITQNGEFWIQKKVVTLPEVLRAAELKLLRLDYCYGKLEIAGKRHRYLRIE